MKKFFQSRKKASRIFAAIESLEGRLLLSSAPPTAPTNFLANNGSTPTDVVLTWNASAGATSYQIWRNTTASTASAVDIKPNATGTSFDDTSVTVGTTYFYWVVASNASGNSTFSTIASATGGTLFFGDTFGSDGISSAWGPYETFDPNNTNVHYTNTLPSQATASNPTTMQIVSDSQATNGQALAMSLMPTPGQSGKYVSSEISTQADPANVGQNIEYGEIQARIKIPGGNNSGAIWPAFWMLGDTVNDPHVGWPASGEIDIMENKGSQAGTNYSTLHGPASGGGDYNGGMGVGSTFSLPAGQSFFSSYHLFSVNWGPNSVTYSVDGQVFATLTPANLPGGASWVFNGHPFYIILDVNEGGSFAPGTITSTQTMYVDDVRAYTFPAPTGINATKATSTVHAKVTWAAVTGATSYEVWRNTTSNNATATELNGNVTGTSFTDNTATAGTTYYYWVVAANVAQTSNFSVAVINQLTPTVTLPSPPSNIGYDGKADVTSWIVPTVTGVSGFPAPTGSATLTYYSGTTTTGTPLSSPPINLGTYTVVASYAGDSNYVPAQSAPLTFTIANPTGLSTGANTQYAINWSTGLPTLDVSVGIVTLSADLSTTFANYALTIENGANVVLSSAQHLSQLQLNGTGTLNIQSNTVIINYGSGADPIATVAAWITAGYANGAWNGKGIVSTTVQSNSGSYGIGYADAADPANPAGLATGTVEIMYTLLGDANLDGKVNGTDFAILSTDFNQAVAGWDGGDFNYDGDANGSDFAFIAQNFNQGVSSGSVASEQTASTVSTVSTQTPASTTTTAPKPKHQPAKKHRH